LNINIDAGGFRPRSDHFFQSGFFEIGRSFDDLDNAVIQIVPALVIRFDITPGAFNALVDIYQSIVTIATATAQQ